MTTITAQNTSILTKEERISLAASWSTFHSTKKASAADMMLYALLRGKPAKTGFTPITSQAKLDNGHQAWRSYSDTINRLYSSLTGAGKDKLAMLLPSASAARIEEIQAELRARIEQARKGA